MVFRDFQHFIPREVVLMPDRSDVGRAKIFQKLSVSHQNVVVKVQALEEVVLRSKLK